ncbi:MAG: nif11-like peptide radical SAM maturase [Chlorobium phaeobacteroides]|uniref:Radical SAM domain protein n=1 Tax=Chlorobium phaeobacteroides (strain BS1) TaxID=331678 RepID=B3ENA7_CHLPB|nr:nif11-like peptide radical SAM maturase [Chlorobium phaeobacteroides]
MNFKAHHKFVHRGKRYVLNIEDMAASMIGDDTWRVLQAAPSFAFPRLSQEAGRDLRRLDLIASENKEAVESANTTSTPIRNIALFITQNCNLACTYCYGKEGGYGSSGHMNSATARKAIDWLIKQSGDIKTLGVAFFGGEPLLNFSLMKKVVEYARQRGAESNKDFEFSITTNGSLLTDEKIAFLNENKINPIVSFDGSKDVQDAQRPFKGGQGSYDVIEPKIRKLLETFPNATARGTLKGATKPKEVTVALNNIGFRSTHMTIASPSLFDAPDKRMEEECGSRSMTTDLDLGAEDLLVSIKSRDADRLSWLKENGDLVSRLTAFVNKEKKYFGCGAGRAYVGVDNTGGVFLCARFVGTKEYKLGNVFEGQPSREKYMNSPIRTVEECKNCFARYICGGGCYHENVGASGAADKPSVSYCRIMRRSVEMVAYAACQLTDGDRKYLSQSGIVRSRSCPFDFPA